MVDITPRILIVEDDLDVAEMLSAFFRSQGYEPLTANWGEDGVRSSLTDHPQLVLLDIRLPDIDGYEVARRIRSDRRTASLPIIFLTEKRERTDRMQGLELGADDYITKPFDMQELGLRVRNALKRVQQGSLTNPVTGLPDSALVDEKLVEVLGRDGVAVFNISIENMDGFRETYGFVAADDVLRAISVVIMNTVKEVSRPEDFLGHLGPADFILLLPAANLAPLSDKLRSRLGQSMEYFYPLRDRDQGGQSKPRLTPKFAEFNSLAGRFSSVDQLKTELMRARK